MVAWMAGLLYVPRLFVYHKENYENNSIKQVFKVMEKRLFYFIATPSMIIVWLSGLYLGSILGFDLWLLLKIGLVFLMTLFHIFIGVHLNRFKMDKQIKSAKFFRLINEIPFLLLLFIVIFVTFKPYF
tara:strand:+ start:198 stop:581 length:384 start_codon:yes stop_codon:yes gene_type:complete